MVDHRWSETGKSASFVTSQVRTHGLFFCAIYSVYVPVRKAEICFFYATVDFWQEEHQSWLHFYPAHPSSFVFFASLRKPVTVIPAVFKIEWMHFESVNSTLCDTKSKYKRLKKSKSELFLSRFIEDHIMELFLYGPLVSRLNRSCFRDRSLKNINFLQFFKTWKCHTM